MSSIEEIHEQSGVVHKNPYDKLPGVGPIEISEPVKPNLFQRLVSKVLR